MKVSTLIKMLDEKYQYYYSGPLHEEIYSVQMVTQDELFYPNTLYIAHEWRNTVMTQNTCLLSIPEKDVTEVVRELRKLVMRDYQRNITLGHMGVLAAGEATIDELCSIVSEIMENPTCFLNQNFQVCIAAGGGKIGAEALKIRQNLQCRSIQEDKEIVLLEPDAIFSYQRLLAPVYHCSNLIGYLYVEASDHPFISGNAEYYAWQICKLLSVRKSLKPPLDAISEEQRFIAELIDGSILDTDLIDQKMKHFGLSASSIYYLVSVDLERISQRKAVIKTLSRLFRIPVCKYKDYCVALIGTENVGGITEKSWPGLIDYLKESGLYAGVSYGFSDLLFMPNAYTQSLFAVSLRKHLSDKVYLSFYGEIVGLHMYQILDASGIDVSIFCDPVAMQIEQYDREHGTQYLNSLVVYICLSCGLQQAADALFIHKNTLLKHIKVLEERFHIDFSNHREVMNLRRTVEIFSFLGKINVQKLLGNEQ